MLADLNVLADALEQDPEIKVVVFQSAHPEIFVAHAGIEWPREQGSRPRRSSRTSGDRPSGSRADLATRFRETNPSEVAGLMVGPPGFEPDPRGKSASNFRYLQDRFFASDKRATNGW